MSLRVRLIRPALRASFALLAVASGAAVANPVSQVGQFEDKSGSILGFFTTEKPNVATIVIQGPKPTEASDKPIMVLFTNKAEWAKFVEMWQKAERSQAKRQATDKIGEYFDADTAAMLAVSVDYQNIIQFIIINKKTINTFNLTAADIAVFDVDVKKVTAYFSQN
jgi:hypothetical protein